MPSRLVVYELVTRLESALGTKPARIDKPETSDGANLFVRDEFLGWSAKPGGPYRYIMERPADRDDIPLWHDWVVTILPDGSRATSRRPLARDRNIYVFGDSWIFGWGLDDELTMAWHLQNEFRDRFAVTSFAYAGYGNLQALLSFRRIKHKIRAEDILVFGYAGFYLVRSAATPAVLAAFADMFANYKTQGGLPLMHPKATLTDGGLQVKLLPLDCAQIAEICAAPKPSLEALYDTTKAIFDEIIASTDAQIVVLNLDGWDGDKVIEYLVSKRIAVVDGRAKTNLFTKDTVGAYEPHPGPFAHHYWYKEVTKVIEKLEAQPRDRDS